MTGIELFIEKLNEKGYKFGETNVSKSQNNGNFELTSSTGKVTTQNYHKIADLYGQLTFYHLSPEAAINQIIEMIETQISIDSVKLNMDE